MEKKEQRGNQAHVDDSAAATGLTRTCESEAASTSSASGRVVSVDTTLPASSGQEKKEENKPEGKNRLDEKWAMAEAEDHRIAPGDDHTDDQTEGSASSGLDDDEEAYSLTREGL